MEEFGKALLRGLGWSDGQGVGRKRQLVEPKQIVRRPERLGLGANPAAPPPEKRPRKMGECCCCWTDVKRQPGLVGLAVGSLASAGSSLAWPRSLAGCGVRPTGSSETDLLAWAEDSEGHTESIAADNTPSCVLFTCASNLSRACARPYCCCCTCRRQAA